MPSTFRCRKFKQARQLAQRMDAPLDFGRPVDNGLIERQMSCQYLQQDVESRLDRGDPGALSFGNAGAFGAALDYERRQITSVRNTQTDPALRLPSRVSAAGHMDPRRAKCSAGQAPS